MRPRAVLLFALLGLLVAGCESEATRSMSDVYIYGHLDARLTYFYGGEGSFAYGDRTLELTAAEATDRRFTANFGVGSALLADGSPFLRESQAPLAQAPITLRRIPLTTDMQLRVSSPVGQVVYFDGLAYLNLQDGTDEQLDVRVVPRPRFNRLRGLGELSNQEADALADALEALRRPFVIAVLPMESLPTRSVDGLAEHRRSAFYVQLDIATDESAFTPAPSELVWETVASGNQAPSVRSARYVLVTARDQLISLWTAAHSAQLQQPALPPFSPERETLVAVFLGQRSTGGYSVSATRVVEERGELYLDVEITEPGPGMITTQVLTSPWLIVKVLRGGYQVAWIRDAGTGELIGAARPGN